MGLWLRLSALFMLNSVAFAQTKTNFHNQPEAGAAPAADPTLSQKERVQKLEKDLKTLLFKVTDAAETNPTAKIVRVDSEASIFNSRKSPNSMAAASAIKELNKRNPYWQQSFPTGYPAKEIVDFTPLQAKEAFEEIIQNNLAGVLDSTFKDYNFDAAVGALANEQRLSTNTIKANYNNAIGIDFNKDEGRTAYFVALWKIKQREKLASEAAAAAAKYDPAAATQIMIDNSAAKFQAAFGNSALIRPIEANDLSSLAENFIDIAAKQITNSPNGDRPDVENTASGNSLYSPFALNTELGKLFQNAMNTMNNREGGEKNTALQLKTFQDLISSKAFLENGVTALGSDNAAALISSVQAAELLNGAKTIDAATAAYLSNAFALGTGVAAPPCIGCVDAPNSSVVKASKNFEIATEGPNSKTQGWIAAAFEISDNASKSRSQNPAEVDALLKGRAGLEKLLAELRLFKSQGILNLVQAEPVKSMSRNYKEGAEAAAGILFLVNQRKTKATDNESTQVEHEALRSSASATLEKLRRSNSPARIETTLRAFFENNNQNNTRALWRKHEDENYRKLRSATAQVIMARALSFLKLPSFEKVTLERSSLALLVRHSLESVKEKEKSKLKEKRIRIGLEQLSPQKSKMNPGNPELKEEVLAIEVKEETPAVRYPSFSEEED